MQALQFDRYGKAEDVLDLLELPEPEPGPGEVKVKMLLSPVNPSDIFNTIEGTYRDAVSRVIWNHGKQDDALTIDPERERPIPSLPHIPGLEGVGVVVGAGKGLYPWFLKHKRVTVVGGARGNWQQYNVVPARQALPVSGKLSDEQAAVSFINPVTAYTMIREVLRVPSGAIVLQSAGNSEVGKMIIRLGKHYGFKTINLVRNATQIEGLKAIGADHVINVADQDLRSEVARITDGRGVPFALDPIAGDLASNMTGCLGLNGRMLVYGTLSSEPLRFSSRDLMTPLACVEGFFLTNFIAGQKIWNVLRITRKAAGLVRSGVLGSDIHATYDLKDFREAFSAVREPGNKGKILLRMNPS